ncbi:YciI family protein [Euzebya sp.]|uniref:YciI family protein n=1 Tax=Euzebya sp. TaxID=1971409 RepID=UPI00351556A0
MRYTLLLHYPEMTPEELGPEMQAEGERLFEAYAAALEQAGVLLAAEVLAQSSATTTVMRRDERLLVQDGPHAATKEQLAGTFLIDVVDADEAIRWAGDAPLIDHGWIEVRPGMVHFTGGAWVPNA